MSCVISSIFALTSVLGNGTIMFVIWKEKDLHSPAFTLLFCLAVADVLVGLISQRSFVAFKTAELLRQYNVYCNLVIWLLISIVTASKIWLGDKWVVFPIVMKVFSILTTAFCTYKIFHIPRKHLNKINKETQAAIHMKSRAVEVVTCKN